MVDIGFWGEGEAHARIHSPQTLACICNPSTRKNLATSASSSEKCCLKITRIVIVPYIIVGFWIPKSEGDLPSQIESSEKC